MILQIPNFDHWCLKLSNIDILFYRSIVYRCKAVSREFLNLGITSVRGYSSSNCDYLAKVRFFKENS